MVSPRSACLWCRLVSVVEVKRKPRVARDRGGAGHRGRARDGRRTGRQRSRDRSGATNGSERVMAADPVSVKPAIVGVAVVGSVIAYQSYRFR